MSFTPLTLLISIILVPTVAFSSLKGYKKGFYHAALKGLSVLLALFTSAMLSSNVISSVLTESVWSGLNIDLGELGAEIPAVETVVKALISAIISPFVFLPVFILIYAAMRILIAVIMAAGRNKDADANSCSEESAPWFRKHQRSIGALTGAISGFIFAVIVTSPLIGTVMNTGQVLSAVEHMQSLGAVSDPEDESGPEPVSYEYGDEYYDDEYGEEDSSAEDLDEILGLIDDFTNDFGATVVYHMGGSFMYNLSARAEIEGIGFTLTKEVAALNDLFSAEENMFAAFTDMTSIEDNELESLKSTCEKLRSSYLLSYTMAGFMSSMCTGWLNGETVMNMAPPELSPEISPMLNAMLEVFSNAYADTVARDMSTLVAVLEILNSSDIFSVSGNYERLISVLADGTFIDSLVAELAKNPRMEPVINNIHVMATQALVNQMKVPGYDEDEYMDFAHNIARELNGMSTLSEKEKVDRLTERAIELVSGQDIEVPESMARLIIENMLKEVKPQSDIYSAKQIMDYLDQFQSENAQ